MENDIKAIALEFIKTLQNRKSFDELIPFYHPNVEQVEFPNMLTKKIVFRNLNDLKEGAERGKTVLQKERFEVVESYTSGNTVIIEARWIGTLAIPFGNLSAGGEMKAHFAQFYEFMDGKIFKQRNYDCFEPF